MPYHHCNEYEFNWNNLHINESEWYKQHKECKNFGAYPGEPSVDTLAYAECLGYYGNQSKVKEVYDTYCEDNTLKG